MISNINFTETYNGTNKDTNGPIHIQIHRDRQTPTYRQQYRGPSALCISARFTSLTAFFTFAYIDQQMKRYKCMLFTTNDLDESDE